MKIKEIVKEVQELGTIQAVTPQGEVTMRNVDGTETKMSKDAFAPTTDPKTLTMKPSDGVDVGDKVTSTETTEAQEDTVGADAILSKIANDEDWDLLYKLHGNLGNPKASEAERAASDIIARMYDDVTVDHPRLHPDDDFEEIYNIVLNHIIDDYGTTEQEQPPQGMEAESRHEHDRDELGGDFIGGDRTDDYIDDISSELEEGPNEVIAQVNTQTNPPKVMDSVTGSPLSVTSTGEEINPQLIARSSPDWQERSIQANGKTYPALYSGTKGYRVGKQAYQEIMGGAVRESAELDAIKRLSGL